MSDDLDDKIEEALAAWPEVETYDEVTIADKTTKRIRANFPPKTRNVLSDDALLEAPFPAEPGEGEMTIEVRRPPRFASDAAPVHENVTTEKKSTPIDVPMRPASSIPPPSSRVARSETPAPSVREENKPEARMGQVERQRDRMSFKDLAKLAQTPPPSSAAPQSARVSIPAAAPSSRQSGDSDSGVVDLQAAAMNDPGAVERSKSTPLASGSLFEDDAPLSVPPPSMTGEHRASGPVSAVGPVSQSPVSQSPVSQQAPLSSQLISPYGPASVRPSAPPPGLNQEAVRPSAVSAVAAVQPAVAQTEQKRSPILAILGGIVVVGSLAAGAVLYVKSHKAPAPVAQAQTQEIAPATAQAAATQAAPTTATAPANDAVALSSLPTTDDSQPVTGSKSAVKSAGHAGAKPKAPAGGGGGLADTLAQESTPPAPEQKTAPVAKDETPPPAPGSGGNLQNAMQTAAGPSDSTTKQDAPTGPKFAPGSVPQRPSQGALASAIGRVLPDARSCLGPDDGVSYATILFESAGGVQNVSLSGFAANKPAGACITTALKKASVGPFAESTYSAKVTVRP